MLKLITIISLLFPPTLFSDDIVHAKNPFTGKDCVDCGYPYRIHTPTIGNKDLREVFEHMNNNNFQICFETFQPSGKKIAINKISEENSLFICSCIKDVMATKSISAADKEVSSRAQKSIAHLAASITTAKLRSEAAGIPHELSELSQGHDLRCDIDSYISQKQDSCNSDVRGDIIRGSSMSIAKEIEELQQTPPLTKEQFLVTPAINRTAELLGQEQTSRVMSITKERLLDSSGEEIFTILEGLNASSNDIQTLRQSYLTSNQQNPSSANYRIILETTGNFSTAITRDYLQYLPKKSAFTNEFNQFYNDSARQSPEKNMNQLSDILQRHSPMLAQVRCESIKRKFDKLCHLEQAEKVLEVFPQSYDPAYTEIYELTTTAVNVSSNPKLKGMTNLLHDLSHSLTEVTHMVSCQDRGQSLKSLYQQCPLDIPVYQQSPEQKVSCDQLYDVERNYCPSFEAFFANDSEFRQKVIDANIGITAADQNLDKILYRPDEDHVSNNCMSGGTIESRQKFRQLILEYLNQNMLNHTFAESFAIDLYRKDKEEKGTGQSDCALSTVGGTISTIIGDGESQFDHTPIAVNENPLSPSAATPMPEATYSNRNTNSEEQDEQSSTSSSSTFTPSISPLSNNYIDQSEGKMESASAISSSQKQDSSEHDAKIAALMDEIERLNEKLAQTNDKIQDNTKELASPQTPPSQISELERQRQELLMEKERLEQEKLNSLQSLNEAQIIKQNSESKKKEASKQSAMDGNLNTSLPGVQTATTSDKGSFSSSSSTAVNNSSSSPSSISNSESINSSPAVNSPLTLTSVTLIDNQDEAKQFFDNQKTFTQPLLYLVDPKNKEMIIKCELDPQKSIGKKEFSKQDYQCSEPIQKESVSLPQVQTKENLIKETPKKKREKVETTQEEEINLRSFDEVKQIINTNQ